MARIRVAVIGLAGVGGVHIDVISRIPEAQISALCDTDESHLNAAKEKCGAEAFLDADALFAADAADVVVIATPPRSHGPLTRKALDAGMHVYCEKPFTLTAGEGYALGRLAREKGRKIQVGFQQRFSHKVGTARRMIDAGRIGVVRRANLFATHWLRSQRYFDERPWRARWDGAGGGALYNLGIHDLDALLWLIGSPSRVQARAFVSGHEIEVEDDIIALMEFPGGARGVLNVSSTDATGTERTEIHGDRGTLILEGDGVRCATWGGSLQQLCDEAGEWLPRPEVKWEKIPAPEGPHGWEHDIESCVRDFLDAVARDRDPLITAEEGTRAIEVANALYMSALTDRPVSLPLDCDAYGAIFKKLCDGELGIRDVRPRP